MIFYHRVWLIISQDLLTNPSRKSNLIIGVPIKTEKAILHLHSDTFEYGVEGRS